MKKEFHLYVYKLLPYPEHVIAPFIYNRSILYLTFTQLILKEKTILNFYFHFKNFSRDLKGDESDLRNRVRSRRNPLVLSTFVWSIWSDYLTTKDFQKQNTNNTKRYKLLICKFIFASPLFFLKFYRLLKLTVLYFDAFFRNEFTRNILIVVFATSC